MDKANPRRDILVASLRTRRLDDLPPIASRHSQRRHPLPVNGDRAVFVWIVQTWSVASPALGSALLTGAGGVDCSSQEYEFFDSCSGNVSHDNAP